MFKKRKPIVISLILVAVIMASAAFIPFPSTFDRVVTAVKLDETGSKISTMQIRITGTRYKSMFSNQLKSLVIHDFDGIDQTNTLTLSQFSIDPMTGYYRLTFGVGAMDYDTTALKDKSLSDSVTTRSYSYTITLHNDLQHLLIKIRHDDGQTVYYACSINESSTNSQAILDEMLDQTLIK